MKLPIVPFWLIPLLALVISTFLPMQSDHNALAAMMKPESALFQILEGNKDVFQFYVEIKVAVYNPEAFAPLNEEIASNLKPYVLAEQSFSQNIVFVRDEFISVETVDANGKVLHIYIEETGGRQFSMNMDDTRFFSDEDIFFPCLAYFTKHTAMFENQLLKYEIVPNKLWFEYQQYGMFYFLGSDTNRIKIEPNFFKILEFQSQLQIQGRYYPLIIEFSEWNNEKNSIPEVSRYFVNSRLFKESRIVDIQFSRIFSKRNSVIKKYQDLFAPSARFNINNNYGQ